MKHFLLFLIFILFFGFIFISQNQNKNNLIAYLSNNLTKLQSTSLHSASFENFSDFQKDKEAKVNLTLYGSTIGDLKSEEYRISYSEDIKSYQSPNRMNNIRFIYHHDGFTAKTRENKIPLFDLNDKNIKQEDKKYKSLAEWNIRFRAVYLSCENQEVNERCFDSEMNTDSDIMHVTGKKAAVENDKIRIEYTNNEKGMRQDFIIKKRPMGAGKLRLELSAETKLKAVVGEEAVTFKDRNGNEKMKYSSLKVWDAVGKELKANFEESNKYETDQISNQHKFCIAVDDKDAVYPVTIDPLSSSPDWTSESNQIDAAYGYSVSTAGDINNDGFSDVIIGAFLYDNGQTDEGKVFVYYGSPLGLLPLALWTAEGNQQNAQFGYSVSSAGDVNNDGYSDVIVGANIYDNDQTDEGRAFVYYGSILGLSSVPNWTSESNQTGSHFGWSVSTAGDINNDGYSDVIIGSPMFDNGVEDEGRAFVYYGSSSGLSASANWMAESNQGVALFGYSVSTAGDVNNDGHDDVIVGANRYDTPIMDEGRAFIYYGSPAGLSLTHSWSSESYPLAFFVYYGNSVSTAGDVNGDGFSDIIVGAYSCDHGEPDEGKVFVYHGSATGLPPVANWTTESNQPYARFGNSVSTAGDVNNDGYSDVIVGSSDYDNGETNEGRTFVYNGSPTGLSSAASWTGETNQANSFFGISVSTAGDVNNDGYSDVIAGSYLYDNGQSNEGSAFVYHGSGSTTKTLNLTMLIQGLYDANTNSMIRDTVTVYLRNTTSPYAKVDSAKSDINPAGNGIFTFATASNELNYYLQIKHRNSLETWSATGLSFVDNVLNFNLSSLVNQAFGSNLFLADLLPLRFAIFNGDVNQDGIMDAADLSAVSNDVLNSVTGYVRTDINFDNFVDASDLSIVDNNAFNGLIRIIPQ